MNQAIAKLKTHPDNQPNEPLTMEELLEMDGNPAWMECGRYNGWVLIGVLTQRVICATDTNTKTRWIYTDKGYNEYLGAKLYRHPLKEGT